MYFLSGGVKSLPLGETGGPTRFSKGKRLCSQGSVLSHYHPVIQSFDTKPRRERLGAGNDFTLFVPVWRSVTSPTQIQRCLVVTETAKALFVNWQLKLFASPELSIHCACWSICLTKDRALVGLGYQCLVGTLWRILMDTILIYSLHNVCACTNTNVCTHTHEGIVHVLRV